MRGRLVLPKNYCNRYQRQLMVTTRRSDEKSWNDAMQTVTFNIRFHQFTCGCSHARKIKVVHGTSKEYHGGKPPFERIIHFWQRPRPHFFLERAKPVTMCWLPTIYSKVVPGWQVSWRKRGGSSSFRWDFQKMNTTYYGIFHESGVKRRVQG